MNDFELDARLVNDCIVLGKLNISLLLLVNNSLLPWFILVPQTSVTEMIDLSSAEQAGLLEEINLVSAFVKANFDISKLNIAAIGNIVSQLHVHIVGRAPADFCWPNVVWGMKQRESYTEQRVKGITDVIKQQPGVILK